MKQAQVALARLEDDSEDAIRASVRRALDHIGGITSYVAAGHKVLLKPNQTLFMPERSGSTTSPRLIRVLVQLCREAGAKEVWVAEAAGHAQKSRNIMESTGMVKGAREAGARLIFLDEIAEDIDDFGEDAGDLRYMPAPEIMRRADVIIDVPKAKTHFMDPISGACKNWVGVIPMSYRLALQRKVDPYYRATALFLRQYRPHLTIFDGGHAGEGQGPGSNEAFWWGWTLASSDPCAADVTVCRLFGLDPAKCRMVREAAQLGVGIFDPDRIQLLGATFETAFRQAKPADPSVDRYPVRVIVGQNGASMEGTLGHWKTIADGWLDTNVWKLFTIKGKPTFLFGDAEDPDFEKHLEEGPYVVLDDAALDKYKYHPEVTFVPGSPVPQSYIQNEMVEGMGFGGIYQFGLSIEKMIEKWKGKRQSTD